MSFDPDDYELRWPPQLFVDEANRLGTRRADPFTALFVRRPVDTWPSDMDWLLREAFVSTVPADTFWQVQRSTGSADKWLTQLIHKAARWPEPDTRKPYWSARSGRHTSPAGMNFDQLTRSFVQVIEEFEANGYLVQVFGQECVDDDAPLPDRSAVLHARLGDAIADWPLGLNRSGWTLDDFCDLVEVFHDLVARPTRRTYHDYSNCGWHYLDFAAGPARRLYRWRVNRLLSASTVGLRLADSGEDRGRLVRVEPTGLEDLPERALQAATPETTDRLGHAIALFRSRNATVEERRSAVITLVGILEERRDLLKVELLTKDETALFQIANQFAVRHQRTDQRGDYDPVFLDWLFWWYLDTVQLTDQLLARQTPASGKGA